MGKVKLTDREKAELLINNGTLISNTYCNGQNTVVVRSYGQMWRIYNAFGKRPKIEQIKENEQ